MRRDVPGRVRAATDPPAESVIAAGDRPNAAVRSACASHIRPSQLSRPRRGTQPRSRLGQAAIHWRAASSAMDQNSAAAAAAASPLQAAKRGAHGAWTALSAKRRQAAARWRRSTGQSRAPAMVCAASAGVSVRRLLPSRRHGSRELVEEVGDLLLFCAREAVGLGVDVCAHSTRT